MFFVSHCLTAMTHFSCISSPLLLMSAGMQPYVIIQRFYEVFLSCAKHLTRFSSRNQSTFRKGFGWVGLLFRLTKQMEQFTWVEQMSRTRTALLRKTHIPSKLQKLLAVCTYGILSTLVATTGVALYRTGTKFDFISNWNSILDSSPTHPLRSNFKSV
jgi:hypothetical protein